MHFSDLAKLILIGLGIAVFLIRFTSFRRHTLDFSAVVAVYWCIAFIFLPVYRRRYGQAASNLGLLWLSLALVYMALPFRWVLAVGTDAFILLNVGIIMAIAMIIESPLLAKLRLREETVLSLEILAAVLTVIIHYWFVESDLLANILVINGTLSGDAIRAIRKWYSIVPQEEQKLIMNTLLGLLPAYLMLLTKAGERKGNERE